MRGLLRKDKHDLVISVEKDKDNVYQGSTNCRDENGKGLTDVTED